MEGYGDPPYAPSFIWTFWSTNQVKEERKSKTEVKGKEKRTGKE